MTRHYSKEQGRAYIHKSCGTTTIVSGSDFVGLCNPFALCLGTICVQCGPSSTKNFVWADTGETVSDFRRRVRRESPLWTIWNWVIAPILGAVIGAAVMLIFGAKNGNPTTGAIIVGVIGALAMTLFIAPFITGVIAGRQFYDRP